MKDKCAVALLYLPSPPLGESQKLDTVCVFLRCAGCAACCWRACSKLYLERGQDMHICMWGMQTYR